MPRRSTPILQLGLDLAAVVGPSGEFAHNLAQCRDAALDLHQRLKKDHRFRTWLEPELDIVTWAPFGPTASRISELSQAIFTTAAKMDLHVATFKYPARLLKEAWPDVRLDVDQVLCLRSCLMKPEHLEWLDRIWQILDKATDKALKPLY